MDLRLLRRSSAKSTLDLSSSDLSSPPSSSASDSGLSSLGSTPSPPSSPTFTRRPITYISPSSSRPSSGKSTPLEKMTPPTSDNDGPAPKRRKLSDPDERKTARLDLTSDNVEEHPQLRRVLHALQKKKKIVVIVGAGISTQAGIPDFRSAGGLFNSLRKEHKLKSSGKDLFDASVYQHSSSTSSFHDMLRELSQKSKDAQATAFHHLLATLAAEGRLLRLYSQNIDGIDTSLEPLKTVVPLPKKGPWPKTVQLHGAINQMTCSKCSAVSEFDPELFHGPEAPECPNCVLNDQVRQVAEKRSHGIGRLRPRMVLYNEHNPDDEAIGSCTKRDLFSRPDAVIVAGTTLKVPGVRRIVREMCAAVRSRKDGITIWINNDPEPTCKELQDCWDVVIKGPCDELARHAAMPRWDDPITYKEVTGDDMAKSQPRPLVLVPSLTPKKTQHTLQVQMPTPGASPRIGPQQNASKDGTPTKGRKRKSNAQAAPAEKKPKVPAKPRKSKAKDNVSEMQKMTSHFSISKSKTATVTTGKKGNGINPGIAHENAKPGHRETPKATRGQECLPMLPKLEDFTHMPPSTPRRSSRGSYRSSWKPSAMAALSVFDARINGLAPSPDVEPFTSAPSSPQTDRYFTPKQEFETAAKRPWSSGSQTIGGVAVPHGLAHVFHTDD
ncbi:DHS-like NAD/FAD-binding domain-containing protein [Sporormia fimetaria CBS 119925]|uniref:DHS-like NAD/FAD-binding domain-containing protein n=1 Tax=Sporormia fimetaria CBS 119925 TaxID=1340428 RepID=A0A6A6V9S2_9PLEO|nr:DHS-like NAD/FAD-binding domain-containing protein [Sporormia fimetaria CBS 119925]